MPYVELMPTPNFYFTEVEQDVLVECLWEAENNDENLPFDDDGSFTTEKRFRLRMYGETSPRMSEPEWARLRREFGRLSLKELSDLIESLRKRRAA